MSPKKSTTIISPRRPPDPAFGLRLRQVRKQRGLSQGNLGERVGVTAAAISTFEKGRIPGDPRVAAALAKELGVSFEWFLTGNIPDGGKAEAQHLTLREVEAEYAIIRKGLAPEVTEMVGDLETILSSGNLDLIKATIYSLHALARSATPPEPTPKARQGSASRRKRWIGRRGA